MDINFLYKIVYYYYQYIYIYLSVLLLCNYCYYVYYKLNLLNHVLLLTIRIHSFISIVVMKLSARLIIM